MRYAVVIERGARGFGAYVPDIPGCVAVAKTRAETVKLIGRAIGFHIEGLKRDGERIPRARSSVEFVEIAA
jgi:predicted RNase H-like HicB family nuclease